MEPIFWNARSCPCRQARRPLHIVPVSGSLPLVGEAYIDPERHSDPIQLAQAISGEFASR